MTRTALDFDIDRLATILRDAAKAEVMPRFRRLSPDDVRQKTSAVDLVTEADEAAERFIKAACAEAWPDATFVGEESTAADPSLLAAVGSAEFAVVVDPVDGTANYASGAPLFTVMAAVVSKGETIAGLIYDPLGDDVMLAQKGAGAFLRRADGSTVALRCADPVPVAEMIGIASHSQVGQDERLAFMQNLAAVRILTNFRCAGHEYRLAASGHLHFSFYNKLMPWDHLAGALIVEEAGGHIRRLDGSHYRPGHLDGGLLFAVNEDSWQAIRDTIFPGRY